MGTIIQVFIGGIWVYNSIILWNESEDKKTWKGVARAAILPPFNVLKWAVTWVDSK